jgi:hypothetical protein
VKISSDYSDLIQFLNDERVRYLIVGGYAAMKYTEPFWTKDLDIWIETTRENADRTLTALAKFGAPAGDLTVEDLLDTTTIYQIGVSGNRIDILTSVSGLAFADAWERRSSLDFGIRTAPVLSLDDMITAAEHTRRPRDRQRVRLLRKARSKL